MGPAFDSRLAQFFFGFFLFFFSVELLPLEYLYTPSLQFNVLLINLHSAKKDRCFWQ